VLELVINSDLDLVGRDLAEAHKLYSPVMRLIK